MEVVLASPSDTHSCMHACMHTHTAWDSGVVRCVAALQNVFCAETNKPSDNII